MAAEYVPARHCLHDADPGAAEFAPAGHSVHDVDPGAAEYVPAGHCMHDEDPGAAEYVPTGQRLGTALPAAAEYCPGEQGVQVVAAPPGENVPTGHNIYQGWGGGDTHIHTKSKRGRAGMGTRRRICATVFAEAPCVQCASSHHGTGDAVTCVTDVAGPL